MITLELSSVAPDTEPLLPGALGPSLEARGLRRVLAASAPEGLVEAMPLNGLLMALHLAYSRHRPLTLSPDDVWLAIAQGLARHIEGNAEAVRSRLVRHTGKVTIETRRDELDLEPSSELHWAAAVEGLTAGVREHLGGRADLFVCNFSTTDARARAASRIVLLGAMQSYFEYVVWTLCGIPRIELHGTPDDWTGIRARAYVLRELDLGWWADALDPVLEKIEAAARGAVDRRFWERIYKVHDASGGEAISGWVNALFPYLGDRGREENPWFERGDEANELELPKLRDYPTGLTSAPFTWRRLTEALPMQLVAGFVGVAWAGAEGVRPAIGWAVLPAAPPRRFRALPRGDEFVTISPREKVASLEGLGDELALDGHACVELSITWNDSLTSLEGIQAAKGVESISLLSCNALRSLAQLPLAPSLQAFDLRQCNGVSDLGPLATMTLRSLAICHCPSIRDYSPVAHVKGLMLLDLFGDSVPPRFRGRHEGVEAIAAVQAGLAGRA